MTKAAPSRMVTWLALLAFLLQGLVLQTHVHLASIQAAAAVHHGQPSNTPSKEPADCPACQLQAAASAVLQPHFITTFLPLSWVESFALPLQAFVATSTAHQGWQSRAPPLR